MMGYEIGVMSTHVVLADLEPGQYVRFNTQSHGVVVMIATREKLCGGSEAQAVYRFLIACRGMTVIDGVPAEIGINQELSIADDRTVIKITDLIHIDS